MRNYAEPKKLTGISRKRELIVKPAYLPLKYTGMLLTAMIISLTSIFCTAKAAGDSSRTVRAGQGLNQDSSAFADKATGWRGKRQRLKQAGIFIDASLVPEGFVNFRGGLSASHTVNAFTFILPITLDTEKLLSWQGGKFRVNLTGHAGQNPSTKLVGDLQIFDNLNAKPFLQIFELWYQQTLIPDEMRVRIGKDDANTCFSVIDNGLLFLNSSTQVSPTLFLFPTTPDPMPAASLFFTPSERYYINFGAYYSNRSAGFGNFEGRPQNVQPAKNGTFLIGEAGVLWRHALIFSRAGNLKLGFWRHTGTFTRFDGLRQRGTYGYYLICNQIFWQPGGESEDGRGLRTFLGYGHTQKIINTIDWNLGWGISWTGLLAARPNDIAGFSPEYAHITYQAGLPDSYELAVEIFYSIQAASWAGIMPDLQYIVNPGGRYPDALVGTVRLSVDF